ncbi:Uma2 family endonuclease [Tsukamurella sp. NPDC003166]|uniref:Uma2 family endonuclease n=1 Tax=Tsukamurella sp. NPDC003166 TaxID=3154444 RepID=UPI0033BD3298
MTAAPNPAPLTLEDWFALGEDESLRRAELCRGVLEVSPSPRLKHTRAIRRLANAIEAQLSGDFEVYDETDVIVHHRPATVRQPDVLVIRASASEPLTAGDVVVAVEILSPGSGRRDRVIKRDEYAAAGIPHYWIIDLDGPSAEVLALVNGRYEGRTVTGRIHTDVPTALDIDLAALAY